MERTKNVAETGTSIDGSGTDRGLTHQGVGNSDPALVKTK